MNRKKAGIHTGEKPRTKRARVRGSMSQAQKVERRKEVQRNYYYNHRTLSPSYEQRQLELELFNLTGLKRCKICGEQKTPDEFYSTKAGAYRLTADCKECRTSISLENYYRRKQRKGN
jgi:hypothetical protein